MSAYFQEVYGVELGNGKDVAFLVGSAYLEFEILDHDTMQFVASELNSLLYNYGYTASYNESLEDIIVTNSSGEKIPYTISIDGQVITKPKKTKKFLSKEGLAQVIQNLRGWFSEYVPVTRKINNKSLTGDIELTASDVGAATMQQVNTAIQTAIYDSWNTGV